MVTFFKDVLQRMYTTEVGGDYRVNGIDFG